MKDEQKKIAAAYETVGKLSNLYDGMMTNSSFLGRLAMKIFWGLSDADYQKFLNYAFAGIAENFSGKLLEVPVGTGVLSLPRYQNLRDAEIFCVDYSEKMLTAAKNHAENLKLPNIKFVRGDVGNLPFEDKIFDAVLSINGFHAFPNKNAAYSETFRILKDGGTFCGTQYIKNQNAVTDFFVKNFCERLGYFTPPFETLQSLELKLKKIYGAVKISSVQSFAGFICRK